VSEVPYPFLVSLAVALAPTAAAHPPNPCSLATNAQVANVLGGTVSGRNAAGNEKFLSCTWFGAAEGYSDAHPSVMLQTRLASKSDFVHEAQTMAGSTKVAGLGGFGFVALGGATLQTWQDGVVLEFDYQMVTGSLRARENLAKLALAHL